MNKEKGLSAIAGTVLMVAIVIAIAAVVYVYVNNWEENQGKCRNTMMNITDYGIGADGQLFFNVNVTNPGGNLTANFTITVNALAIENRIEKGVHECLLNAFGDLLIESGYHYCGWYTPSHFFCVAGTRQGGYFLMKI